MYSVVLLMALSGGAQAPDGLFHKNSCCGGSSCSGGYVVSSCSGGSSCGGGYVVSGCCGGSSCHGGGHGSLFGGHKSSCCGGSSCHGGGGLFGGHHKSSCCGGSACCGGGYSSCSGYSGGYSSCTGCSGGYLMSMPPPPPVEPVKPPKPKEEKPKGEVSAPAMIFVTLPADAKVTIDGAATTSTSSLRSFVTPDLDPAKEFVYTLSAEIVRDGQKLTVSEKITVRAGAETRVDFAAEKFASTTIAAK